MDPDSDPDPDTKTDPDSDPDPDTKTDPKMDPITDPKRIRLVCHYVGGCFQFFWWIFRVCHHVSAVCQFVTFCYFHLCKISFVLLGFAFYFSLLVFRFASSSAFVSRPLVSAFSPFHLLFRVLSAFVSVLGFHFAPVFQHSVLFTFCFASLLSLFQFSSAFVSGPLFSVFGSSPFVFCFTSSTVFVSRLLFSAFVLRPFLLLFAFVSRPPFAFLLAFVSRSPLSAFGSRTFRFLFEYLFSIHSVPVDFASFAALVSRLIAHVYSK